MRPVRLNQMNIKSQERVLKQDVTTLIWLIDANTLQVLLNLISWRKTIKPLFVLELAQCRQLPRR